MLDKIIHRWSSNFEYLQIEHTSLWANRLPIQWRDNWKQPISNESCNIFAVLNGEIFNYQELRQRLESKWHIFQTDTDTELLPHLYEEYWSDLVHHLNSEMFTVIIYDQIQDLLTLFRDPYWVKPLYYWFDVNKTNLYAGSEVKQFIWLPNLDSIHRFLPWHYATRNSQTFTMQPYLTNQITQPFEVSQEHEAISKLDILLHDLVRSRVNTDLPIGVLCSGGVDSSLLLYLAHQYHNDVVAIIAWYEWSPDYEYATRLCEEMWYRYEIATPESSMDDIITRLENNVYWQENFDPLILFQWLWVDYCCQKANELGLQVILTWEWPDELFAGYDGFKNIPTKYVNDACRQMTKDMYLWQMDKLDRLAMKYTIENRLPFWDQKLVQFSQSIPAERKIQYPEDGLMTTKYLFRKVAEQYLPDYIAQRPKLACSNGVGLPVGHNYKLSDGEIEPALIARYWWIKLNITNQEIVDYDLTTFSEKYFFHLYKQHGYTILQDWTTRLRSKDTIANHYIV